MVLSVVMILPVIGDLTQLFIWALVFQFLDEFTTLSEAVYHSAVNFATLGYGDIVMSERHRLLGPLEAINGVCDDPSFHGGAHHNLSGCLAQNRPGAARLTTAAAGFER